MEHPSIHPSLGPLLAMREELSSYSKKMKTTLRATLARACLQITQQLSQCRVQCQKAQDFSAKRDSFLILARDNLASARARQKHYADNKRRNISFKEGNLVLLRSENLETFNRSDIPPKWRPKYWGHCLLRTSWLPFRTASNFTLYGTCTQRRTRI